MEEEFTKSYAIKRIAELTEQIEEWRSLYSALMKDCQMQIEENNELKQQLEKKENEIERLKYTVDFYKSYYISFKEKVIDELEKVKELCRKDMTISEDYFTIAKILNHQIEKLKKENEQNDK